MSDNHYKKLRIPAAGAAMILLAGCADIQYMYNIPGDQNDCPTATVHRSGGTRIVDRSGTRIVDRSGNDVFSYCEPQVCPDGVTVPTGDPVIVWHQEDHKQVLARGTCPAT